MNKYEDMSVLEVLKQIKNEFIFLPDIQREYCWDMSDIESLFESIVDGYPIGSFIFWKTNRKKLNETKPNLYKFLSVYKPNYTKNEEAPESFDEEGDYFIVLDGQQRLTSMNIALKGKFITKKKFKKVNNREAWVERELYYNLNFHNVKQDEKDEENPEKRFVFLSKEECENGNYFKIKNILEYSSVVECVQKLGEITSQKEVVEDLSVLFEKLNSSGSGTIHYYCITKNDYDEALNIFVKVNSTGKKLSKTDLLFSTLIDGWKEGKKLIDSTIQTINQKGRFNFKRDYVMRLCLVLVDASAKLKIESLKKEVINKIRENWNKISETLIELSNLLADISLSDECLTSYNATMPLAYYIYKGGKFKSQQTKAEALKFLSVSMTKRLFGVASNNALDSTRNVLKEIDCKKTEFALELFKEVDLLGKNFEVTEKDICYWLDTYTKGPQTFVILTLLYPDLTYGQNGFEQDHLHPHSGFEKSKIAYLGLSEEKLKDWQIKRNKIPNLQLLRNKENEEKNDEILKKWVEEGNDFDYRPQSVSLELSAFDEFYKERRKLIKSKLLKIFGIEEEKENDL